MKVRRPMERSRDGRGRPRWVIWTSRVEEERGDDDVVVVFNVRLMAFHWELLSPAAIWGTVPAL